MDIYALDTETGPYPQPAHTPGAWALEPYRPDFYVKLLGVYHPAGSVAVDIMRHRDDAVKVMSDLNGAVVYCHNTLFDISVLIREFGYDMVKNIRWRDTSLLAKWVNNSQKDEKMRYSLRNCVDKWLPDNQKFLDMKDNIEDDYDYWLERVIADCKLTHELAVELENLLPDHMYKGYVTECACLLPLARGYMRGIYFNTQIVAETQLVYQAGANKLLREAEVTESQVRSPKQLGNVLFNKWSLEPTAYTASGTPSTAAGALKELALTSNDERLIKLMEAKKKLTVISKYVNGFNKTLDYIGEATMHPVPRLFNSYTGRMSYNSKLFKKFQVGIAMHQLPRKDKDVKRAIIAPNGYKFLYMDFSAQELRLMAQFSKDPRMVDAFNNNIDLHSTMTESLFGIPYDEVVEGNKNGDADIVDKRNAGKLTNLSSMYRIGAKSLKTKFFEQYDTIITMREATHYLNTYKKTFRGIPKYWQRAVEFARAKKYAETLSGRRFYVNASDWKGESSAINFPIQGSGADLSELAIALISRQFPELIFQIQVHDSLTWLIPVDMDVKKVISWIKTIDYQPFFKQKLVVDFPFDFAYGDNLSGVEAI